MTLPLAVLAVGLTALVGNRIVATAVGVWFHIPTPWLFTELVLLDVVQIPFFFWLYENSSWVLERLPVRISRFFQQDPASRFMSAWATRLGNAGVFVLAALPTFGGGMWSAIFLAYGMKLNRRTTYASLVSGSAFSYCCIYWVVDTLISVVRYFGSQA